MRKAAEGAKARGQCVSAGKKELGVGIKGRKEPTTGGLRQWFFVVEMQERWTL